MAHHDEPKAGLALLLSGEHWKRRFALWGGGLAVARAALVVAKASDAPLKVIPGVVAQ
jgi:hypothetical protein